MHDLISHYYPAIAAATVLCLMVLIQGFLGSIFGIVKGGQVPGEKLEGDYSNFGFRTMRTHLNSVENLSVFVLALILALVTGAEQLWVNLLAVSYVTLRIVYWIIYYLGLGANATGPRTIVFVLGWATNFALAIIAAAALLQY